MHDTDTQFKVKVRQGWDAAAAGWKQWWPTFEQGAQVLSNRLIELANVQRGQQVLDVATGIGEPAITAAHRVGPEGRVVATDLSPQMLAIARERASTSGLANLVFYEADAETLDIPEDAFDAILCRWGLMLFPDCATALGRMRRLLAPGGRLAAAVWGVPPHVPFASLAAGVMREELTLPPSPPGTPGIFALADPNLLEQKFAEAGFVAPHIEPLTVRIEWQSAEAYTRFLQDVSRDLVALVADQPTERQREVWQAVCEAARKHTTADGTLRMDNACICIVGQQ
jgi:ubiquinone/menaquinone biosynthesis C-methylase UbiE